MDFDQIIALAEQDGSDSILEIECKECGTTIIAEPDSADLYCKECKMIIMQTY